jgi:hypothetical protein
MNLIGIIGGDDRCGQGREYDQQDDNQTENSDFVAEKSP